MKKKENRISNEVTTELAENAVRGIPGSKKLEIQNEEAQQQTAAIIAGEKASVRIILPQHVEQDVYYKRHQVLEAQTIAALFATLEGAYSDARAAEIKRIFDLYYHESQKINRYLVQVEVQQLIATGKLAVHTAFEISEIINNETARLTKLAWASFKQEVENNFDSGELLSVSEKEKIVQKFHKKMLVAEHEYRIEYLEKSIASYQKSLQRYNWWLSWVGISGYNIQLEMAKNLDRWYSEVKIPSHVFTNLVKKQ